MSNRRHLPPDDQPPPPPGLPTCRLGIDSRHANGLNAIVRGDTVFALGYYDDGCLSFRMRGDVPATTLSQVLHGLADQIASNGDFRITDGTLTVAPPDGEQ